MPRPLPIVLLASLLLASRAARADLPEVVVDRDNVEIRTSCRVVVSAPTIVDADGNGVVQIVAEGVTVDFGGGRLAGAIDETALDRLAGVGVRVLAAGVTLRNLRLAGYKVGVWATGADGLTIEDVTVERNFGQRLRSTPRTEDPSDWLRPHENDAGEWRTRYGAAVCIERARGVTVRRVTVRRSQNGIVIDRVDDSRLYDNDCSFLSGWGLAMWRSSGNVVSRNAFDFCVRGYSDGVYNRGQDSAGILVFEQCSRNVFVENSCTHGGDGIFGFAGRQALGELDPPADAGADWHLGRGCNENLFVNNDLSFAAAHGLEMTFGFGNRIHANRFVENAICGIWGGYSQQTVIAGNRFDRNGDMAYGLERGGVNMEHAVSNRIVGNVFTRNRCGVHLWWDADPSIAATPWGVANDLACHDNVVARNRFDGDTIAIQLRHTGATFIADNAFTDVGTEIEADEGSLAGIEAFAELDEASVAMPAVVALGERQPVGARRALRGRSAILMTEWGPYDHASPMLHRIASTGALDEYRLLGAADGMRTSSVIGRGPLRNKFDPETGDFRVFTAGSTLVCPYELRVTLEDRSRVVAFGTVASLDWTIRLFPWTVDPRENADAWNAAKSSPDAVEVQSRSLDLLFAGGGPAQALERLVQLDALHPLAPPQAIDPSALERAAALPVERFGTVATAEATFRPGRYRLVTTSDDGVRLWVDGELVIDNWTWHGPTEDVAEITIDEERTVNLRLEHFELDGFAQLAFRIEAVDQGPR